MWTYLAQMRFKTRVRVWMRDSAIFEKEKHFSDSHTKIPKQEKL